MNKCRRTVVQCGILSQMLPLSSEKKTELQKHWINNKSTVQLYDSTYIRFNKFTYKMYKQAKPVKINKIGNGT